MSAEAGPITSFCIDFNWDRLHQPASPGLFAEADPVAQVEWMADLGVRCIQSFCVTLNGHAWYPSDTHPRQPGGGATFLPRLCEAAGKKNMSVMGYFCLGGNPVWSKAKPDLVHGEIPLPGPSWNAVMTDEYLDYFCAGIREVLQVAGIDGFMIDWFRPTLRGAWLECERSLYREIMDEKFPQMMGVPVISTALVLEYERRLLNRAWRRIREAAEAVRPCTIWINPPFFPGEWTLWEGLEMLREADWVLNEDHDLSVIPWLRRQVGPHTKIIQTFCGLSHDAETMLSNLPDGVDGIYGYAGADPVHGRFEESGSPRAEVNARNVRAMRKYLQAL